MNTKDWLLQHLINTATKLEQSESRRAQSELSTARETIKALEQRVSELVPSKQFVIKEGGLSGESAIRTIQSVYSSNGKTTITI